MLSPARCLCVLLAVTSAACHKHTRYTDQPANDDAGSPDDEVDESDDAAQDPPDDVSGETDAGQSELVDADVIATDAGSIAADAESDADYEGPSTRGGNNFASAPMITLGGPPLMIDERRADQIDYFAFKAEAGKFYEITTDSSVFSPDNVLKLFDANQQQIAENDYGSLWLDDAIDTRLLVHIAKSGTYYVSIEDLITKADFFTSSTLPLLFYHLIVREITDSTPGFAIAKAGSKVPLTFQHDDKSGYDYVTLLGTTSAGDDSFAFQSQADKALIGHVTEGGPDADGSTFKAGRFRVSSDDAGVLAEIDRELNQLDIHPPISAGGVTVSASSAGGTLGENAYYSLDLVQLPDNPREQAEAANNTLAGAETITFKGTSARRGLLLAQLPANDVDYFRLELMANEGVRASCEAESGGSGVRKLVAELRDSSDQVLGSAMESTNQNLSLSAVKVPSAGSYYLRISAGADELAPAINHWVRCVVLVNR